MATSLLDRPFACRDGSMVAVLDERERTVCYLVGIGTASKRIATLLDVGLRTVEQRRSRIAAKLGLDDVGELPLWAARNLEHLLPYVPVTTTPVPDEVNEQISDVRSRASKAAARARDFHVHRQPAGPQRGDPSVEEIYARARDLRTGKAVLECSY